MDQKPLNDLQTLLVELYGPDDIARLLTQAGVGTDWLAFSPTDTPRDAWFRTITGLHRQRDVDPVVQRAIEEFPNRAGELKAMLAAYHGALQEEETGAQAVAVAEPGAVALSDRVVILFWAANPVDTDPLSLGVEARTIDDRIRKAAHRDRFDFEQVHALRITDLTDSIIRYRPNVVHFSGHGSSRGEIVTVGDDERARTVAPEALANFFDIARDSDLVGNRLGCVVLNACYTGELAEAISRYIPCVVGTAKAIGDDASIAFAGGFYRALADGENVDTAFRWGSSEIALEGLGEEEVPQLHVGEGVDPKTIRFVSPD